MGIFFGNSTRRRQVAVASLVFVSAVVLLSACARPGAAAATPQPVSYSAAVISPPLPKADFTMTDTSGKPFDFRKATNGQITLLYFGYTHCPDACPTFMQTVALALKKLPPSEASKVRVVMMTVDPARDTPQVFREWLDNFDKSFIGLTGDIASVGNVMKAYGIPEAQLVYLNNPDKLDYFVDHFSGMFVYAQDNQGHLLYPAGVTPDQWASDLNQLLKNGWRQP